MISAFVMLFFRTGHFLSKSIPIYVAKSTRVLLEKKIGFGFFHETTPSDLLAEWVGPLLRAWSSAL